jgi:hypothetical protein
VSSAHSSSPLWLVTNEPHVNELVSYLDAMRRRVEASPNETHRFEFSRSRLAEVRTAFARMIRHGEEQLHKVCELLCETFLDSTYTLQSVVIGEVETTKERFTLVKSISPGDLYSQTDLDLGTRQLRRLRYHDGGAWSRASLVANVVEYQPAGMNEWGIHKVISRIKAEEQIWNKVVDSIFALDHGSSRTAIRHLGGSQRTSWVKAVVGDPRRRACTRRCRRCGLRSGEIRHPAADRSGLEFIEVKDYTAEIGRKETGWEAIKVETSGRRRSKWYNRCELPPGASLAPESHASSRSGVKRCVGRRRDRLRLLPRPAPLAVPVARRASPPSKPSDRRRGLKHPRTEPHRWGPRGTNRGIRGFRSGFADAVRRRRPRSAGERPPSSDAPSRGAIRPPRAAPAPPVPLTMARLERAVACSS